MADKGDSTPRIEKLSVLTVALRGVFDRFIYFGIGTVTRDLPGSGRPIRSNHEAKTWVIERHALNLSNLDRGRSFEQFLI
jgi:hypothetical protein